MSLRAHSDASPSGAAVTADSGPRNGADLLVDCLASAGIHTLFGVPGDTGVDLYQALASQDRVHHVMARDERHAATMADAYARCTNTVGVVEVSSGGGATFSIGGLGEPFAASIPMLVISSDIHSGSRGSGALTEIDQEKLFSAVTKWRTRIACAAEIPAAVVDALTQATTGRPAPVALIVPEDVLAEPTTATAQQFSARIPGTRPVPALALLKQLADDLQRARRPVIVAGSGVHLSGAWAELATLADQAGIPIATTIHGKGAYPETAPWSLGVVGANGGRGYVNDYVAKSDLVMFVGTRANATDTDSFQSPPRTGLKVYQLNIDPAAPRNFKDATCLIGDAKAILAELLKQLPAHMPKKAHAQLAERLHQLRDDWQRECDVQATPTNDEHVSARAALRTIQLSTPPNAIVVADCGTPTPLLAADWETGEPGRTVIVARGHGPMGWAIPAAVGAAFAHPGRRIICITTDGSLTMACGEFATAVQHHLPITFVQLTNGSYGWIKMLQHLYFGRRYFGVDLQPVDGVAVARGFGMAAKRVDSLTQLGAWVKSTPGPSYADVHVPEQFEEVPPVAPWHAALAGQASRPVY